MNIWAKLQNNHSAAKDRHILSLLGAPERMAEFSKSSDGLVMDFSKTNIDSKALSLLIELAEASDVAARRDAMFAGEKINETENRAVLHTALRSQSSTPILVDGEDVLPEVRATRDRMSAFVEDLRSGKICASDGQPFTDVINIGIGGSDLGPVMAVLALAPYHDGPRCHFVSNVDGAHFADIAKSLDPARTLVIVASKTFTTIETMTNADTAVNWLRGAVGDAFGAHLVAVSSALDKTAAFGIHPDRVFGFEDWVGGRYSLWGPIGLPIMLAIGSQKFSEFLGGGASMDAHFCNAPFSENLPVLLSLVGIWHNNICGYDTRAVLPYEQRLSRFPAYLQQLDMESNGKSVTLDGAPATRTGPVVWGEPGTNGQHAFYQLVHQGTHVIPAEFLVGKSGHETELAHHHTLLKANCLAQSEALLLGRDLNKATEIARAAGYEGDELAKQAAQRVFPGNRPSVTIVYPQLTPFVLGQLIALYEHRVFCEGVIWGINSFDQWGVELGKELAKSILPELLGEATSDKDASTRALISLLSA